MKRACCVAGALFVEQRFPHPNPATPHLTARLEAILQNRKKRMQLRAAVAVFSENVDTVLCTSEKRRILVYTTPTNVCISLHKRRIPRRTLVCLSCLLLPPPTHLQLEHALSPPLLTLSTTRECLVDFGVLQTFAGHAFPAVLPRVFSKYAHKQQ